MRTGPRSAAPRIALVLGLLLLAGTALLAEKLPVRGYTVIDGLADDDVRQVLLDSRGFLWFCTRQGLSRYDGKEFTSYGVEAGLPDTNLRDMIEIGDGELLLLTGDGLARFPARDEGAKLEGGPARTHAILRGRDGRIWTAGARGIFELRLSEGAPRFVALDFELPNPRKGIEPATNALIEDDQGALWVGHSSGLYRWRSDEGLSRYTTEHGLPSNHITALAEDDDGAIWVGTTAGLARVDALTIHGLAIEPLRAWIHSVLPTSDGRLWVASKAGLTELPADGWPTFEGWRLLTSAHGLARDYVACMAEDGRGNLWMGTASAGLKRLSFVGMVAYGEEEGLASRRVRSLLETRDGEVCAVTEGAERFLDCVRDGRIRSLRPAIPGGEKMLGWGWNQIFLQDRAGEWWLATGEGLARFPAAHDPEELERAAPRIYTTEDGLPGDYVFRVFEDSAGGIWTGSLSHPHQLARWDRAEDRFRVFESSLGIPAAAPTAFVEDDRGAIWIGFYLGGVARYLDGRFDFFDESQGCPPGFVRALHLDSRNRIWVATARGGVARIDEPHAEKPGFRRYTTQEGLSSDLVSSITEDTFGRIYLGTSRGVDRLDPDNGIVRHYSTADGLPNSFANVALRDRAGRLWFGTLGGLARLDPRLDMPSLPSPNVFISGLKVAGEALAVSETGVEKIDLAALPPDSSPVEIEYVAPGENLHYLYRLGGGPGDAWAGPTRDRAVHFANLAPGHYRFQVKAVNAEGVESAQPAEIAFVVLRPLWQRGWFVVTSMLLLAALVVLLYRARVAGLRRRQKELAQEVADRTRELLEAKGQLEESNRTLEERVERGIEALRGAERMAAYGQLVSGVAHEVRHPIFSLQAAAYVLGDKLHDRGDLTTQLRILDRETKRMTALMDDLLEFARPQALALEPTDPVSILREAEETFRSAGVEPEPDVILTHDESLPSLHVDRRRMLQIFVNLMENARKHAEGVTTISLSATAARDADDRSQVVFQVTNDGAEMSADLAEKIFEPFYTSGRGTGLGLTIVRRVVADHGGTIEFDTGPNRGTRFTITVPAD